MEDKPKKINASTSATVALPATIESCKLVVAPTGSGKTYNAAKLTKERMNKGEKSVVVLQDKAGIENFRSELRAQIGCEDSEIGLHGVFVLESYACDIDDALSKSNVPDDFLVLLTHHSYILRKGVSNLYYSLLSLLWQSPKEYHVIVDEVHLFVEKTVVQLSVNPAYMRKKQKGLSKDAFFLATKCPVSSRSGNYNSLVYRSHQAVEIDQFHNYQINEKVKVFDGDPETKIDLFYRTQTTKQVGNYLVSSVRKNKSESRLLEPKTFVKPNEVFDLKEELVRMIDESHNPTEIKSVIVDKTTGTEVQPDCAKPGESIYPYFYHGHTLLNLQDSYVLRLLFEKARSLQFQTATITAQQEEFLRTYCPTLVREDLGSPTKIQSDVILCFVPKIPTLEKGKYFLKEFDTALRFYPTRSKAEQEYEKVPKSENVTVYNCFGYSETSKKRGIKQKHIFTHSRSSLGVGANMPDFQLVMANGSRKPKLCFCVESETKESMIEKQNEDSYYQIIQNLGRILRGEGRKVLVVEECHDNISIITEVAKRCKSFQVFNYYYDVKAWRKDALRFLEGGPALNTEKSIHQEVTEKKVEKELKKLKTWQVNIEKYKADGLPASVARKRMNLDRKTAEEKEIILRMIYEAFKDGDLT